MLLECKYEKYPHSLTALKEIIINLLVFNHNYSTEPLSKDVLTRVQLWDYK